jgi:hypothetical protein
MGSNPTQAQAFALFLIAFVLLAGAFASGNLLYAAGFVVFFGASLALFLKCKPWEHREE